MAVTDGPSSRPMQTSFVLVTPRRRYRGDIHSQSCLCVRGPAVRNEHTSAPGNQLEGIARSVSLGAPVRLGIHEGFWRSPKEHPVAPLAGAVNPRWARGDSMNVVVGFDTRFEAWRECNSRSSQPAAPVRWSWTDGSGVKYSPGVPSFGGAPRHVMATCTDAASVRAADSGVARCDRVVAAALPRNGRMRAPTVSHF